MGSLKSGNTSNYHETFPPHDIKWQAFDKLDKDKMLNSDKMMKGILESYYKACASKSGNC
jgi:hypothetical protein